MLSIAVKVSKCVLTFYYGICLLGASSVVDIGTKGHIQYPNSAA